MGAFCKTGCFFLYLWIGTIAVDAKTQVEIAGIAGGIL